MRLVHKDGREVVVGETVTDFRGDTATVTGWETPRSPASTGRLYVKAEDGWTQGYYPSVFDCEWIEREDRS